MVQGSLGQNRVKRKFVGLQIVYAKCDECGCIQVMGSPLDTHVQKLRENPGLETHIYESLAYRYNRLIHLGR